LGQDCCAESVEVRAQFLFPCQNFKWGMIFDLIMTKIGFIISPDEWSSPICDYHNYRRPGPRSQ
jgi:hypothetical protein